MKPGFYNFDRRPLRFGFIITCLLIVGSMISVPARADKKKDLQKMMQFAEFGGLMTAVAELNRSMRLAAENPMDEWRRKKVRAAMAALPGAIQSMAGVFQANKLGDSKLPMMQQILGGFVDVNAADNYNKFLKSPSYNLIPKVGADFPKQYLNGSAQVSQGGGPTPVLVVDESATKAAATGLGSSASPSGAFEAGIQDELINIEAGLTAKNRAKRVPAVQPGAQIERLKLNPQFFNTLPLSLILSSLMTPEALAKGGGEEDESGSKAAEFLFGMAAIMGAISPMVAAGVQAKADKEIAKTNQQTAIATTEISANTSKFLAQTQKGITEQQIAATQQMASTNNEEATKRLNLQLAELRSTREEGNQIQREKRNLEYQLNQQRIALAERQANDNIQLAKATLSAQIAQAGLNQGITSGSAAANPLAVTRTAGGVVSSTGNGLAGLTPRAKSTIPSLTSTRAGSTQRAAASSRLLGGAIAEQSTGEIGSVKSATLRRLRSARGIRGVSSGSPAVSTGAVVAPVMSRQLSYMMQANLDLAGSSPERRAGSDLSLFRAQVSANDESFAGYKKRALTNLTTAMPEPIRHNQVLNAVQSRGYNAPTLTLEGSTHSVTQSGARGFFNLPVQ